MNGVSVLRRKIHVSYQAFNRANSEIASIIRVDHAGELGADRIYAGQMAILGKTKSGPLIKEMWEQEKRHKRKFEELIVKHRVRPTVMTPLWNIAGFALGAGTALLGEKAAMACTVAVESVIVDHYNDQLREIMSQPNADQELLATIKEFRDEEQEHHDIGLDQGAEQAPVYRVLSSSIKFFCRTAIAISKGLLCHPASTQLVISRRFSTTIEKTEYKWDLVSAVCVERKPVIVKPLTEFEKRYMDALAEIELVNSHKSTHEIRHEDDLKTVKKEDDDIELELDGSLKQTAQDFEDASTEELARFTKASYATKADQTGNSRTHNRKLDSHLCLLTQMQLGPKPLWILPQAIWTEGETLRDTAMRALIETCGSNLDVTILGNAPFGFYKYKYPRAARTPAADGAKLFFFKGIYKNGDVVVNGKSVTDHQWVTREEMINLVESPSYLKSIQMFLVDE